MKRREFLKLMAGAAGVAAPHALHAQEPGRVYRLGQLTGGTAASRAPLLRSFMQGMQALGYVEGQNLLIEHRYSEGRFDLLPEMVRQLLDWKPDVMLVSTTPANLAAKSVTSTAPIVMVGVADPVGVGLVESLARPGGNITGITNIGAELAGKRLEILREIVPSISSVAVLINPDDQNANLQMRSVTLAADRLGISIGPVLHIRNRDDVKPAFDTAARSGTRAALRMIDPLTITLRRETVALAAERRVALIYPFREDVQAGGLVSYGTSLPDQYRQAAAFVHKLFNGAKPQELPVEQPTKFELAINLKAAAGLGITIPPSLLARADEVVE